jgi:large subunit ribosomal protein L5
MWKNNHRENKRSEGEIMARLKELYDKTIRKELGAELSISNIMAVPQFKKVVVNAGVGRAVADAKIIDEVVDALSAITGQKPIKTIAKKSIAGFKLREGVPVGVAVTLRGERMYEFLDRLVNSALPRVRDFRGISKDAFDGHGNYSVGIKEHTVFPELIGKDVTPISFQVNIETTAKSDDEARELLKKFNFPFTK